MSLTGPRRLLRHAELYRLFKNSVGTRHNRWLVDEHIRPETGSKVLDIGCGPGHILDLLPPVDYTGFDISADYIAAAKRQYGARGTFVQGSVVDPPLLDPDSFDIAIAKGVLHHLDDTEAASLFELARDVLQPGGRLVTFDGCFEQRQSSIARFLLRMDRGEHVRDEQGYIRLANKTFDDTSGTIRRDLLRVPYTHLILECTRTTSVNYVSEVLTPPRP